MIDFLANNYGSLLIAASGVISGSSIALLAISKVTKNTKDDRAASFLVKVAKFLEKLSLNVR